MFYIVSLMSAADPIKKSIWYLPGWFGPVASFTKEVNPRLAKRPLKTNGRLAHLGLTSLVKMLVYPG